MDRAPVIDEDGIQSPEWHAAVKLIESIRRPRWLALRAIRRQMSRTDVDFIVVDRYILILLAGTLRGLKPGYPSEAELVATARRIYPEWSRTIREDETILRNTLLMSWGYGKPLGAEGIRESIPYMATAVSALTKGSKASVSSQRTFVAERCKEYLEILREKYGDDFELR